MDCTHHRAKPGWLRLLWGQLVHAKATAVLLSLQYKMALRRKNKHFRSIRPTPTVRSKASMGLPLCCSSAHAAPPSPGHGRGGGLTAVTGGAELSAGCHSLWAEDLAPPVPWCGSAGKNHPELPPHVAGKVYPCLQMPQHLPRRPRDHPRHGCHQPTQYPRDLAQGGDGARGCRGC